MKCDAILIQIRSSYIHMDLRGGEPQLGQYYIAEYAHRAGFDIKVKSYSSNDAIFSSLSHLISELNCLLIGFYLDSENVWVVRKIITAIKGIFPNIKIVIGGPQVTGDSMLALRRIPFADYAIEGEGERPFTELLNYIKNDSPDLSEINGLLYRQENTIKVNHPQVNISSIDMYPWPRRYDYTLDENIIFDQISTGRGCVGKCAFCFEGNKKNNVLRLRSVDGVIEEIDYLISNLREHKYLSFLDDTFILSKSRTTKICSHLIDKYDGQIGWFCEGRVDILKANIEMLPLIKKAGNIRIQLGGESGNQTILNSYNKNMILEDLIYVVEEIYKSGIPSIYVNFIIGGAHETIDSFNETLELAKKLLNIAPACAEVGSSLLTPYVGTPIRNNPSHYDIELVDPNMITGPDGFIPFCRSTDLSIEKIQQLKAIFDAEILKEHFSILKRCSNEQIFAHYKLKTQYGMFTNWLSCSNEIESYKNYFEPQIEYGFVTFPFLIESGFLDTALPYRTVQPISDGVYLYAQVDREKRIILSGLSLDIFMLSAGKLSYFEIVSILKNKYADNEAIAEDINSEYYKFDKLRLVIWKYLF